MRGTRQTVLGISAKQPFESLIKDIWNLEMKGIPNKTVSRAKNAKHVLSNVEGDAKVTGRSQSSRANARDLRRRFLALLETRISPFGRNDKRSFFASLACLAR